MDDLIGIEIVSELTSLSERRIQLLVADSVDFPCPVEIKGVRRVVWRRSDITAWIASLSERPRA